MTSLSSTLNRGLLMDLGRAYAALGDTEKASELFKRAVRGGWTGFEALIESPETEDLEDLKASPGFAEFLEQYRKRIAELREL